LGQLPFVTVEDKDRAAPVNEEFAPAGGASVFRPDHPALALYRDAAATEALDHWGFSSRFPSASLFACCRRSSSAALPGEGCLKISSYCPGW